MLQWENLCAQLCLPFFDDRVQSIHTGFSHAVHANEACKNPFSLLVCIAVCVRASECDLWLMVKKWNLKDCFFRVHCIRILFCIFILLKDENYITKHVIYFKMSQSSNARMMMMICNYPRIYKTYSFAYSFTVGCLVGCEIKIKIENGWQWI